MNAHKISEIELIYRPSKYSTEKLITVIQSEAIFRRFWNTDAIEYYEEFKVMYLNRANQILGIYHHARGGGVGVYFDIRMIFQGALKANANAIIIAHNHPSGNLDPSPEDREMTRRIKEAGVLLEIRLLDSLILTSNSYTSFVENGYL
jgi:DNA repair protein RadC